MFFLLLQLFGGIRSDVKGKVGYTRSPYNVSFPKCGEGLGTCVSILSLACGGSRISRPLRCDSRREGGGTANLLRMRRVESQGHGERPLGVREKAIMPRGRGPAKITSDPGKRAQECELRAQG